MAKYDGENIDPEAQNKDIGEQIRGAKTENHVACLYEIPDPLPPLLELYNFGKKKVSFTSRPKTKRQGKRKYYEEHGGCELPARVLKKKGKKIMNNDTGESMDYADQYCGLPDIVEPLPENLDELWRDDWPLENFFDNATEF